MCQDIAVVMGIVPENQYLLGLEGAGVINRVGPRAAPYTAGQRVLVYRRGTFANRVQVSKDCIHLLPDSMTFEVRSKIYFLWLSYSSTLQEAATLACTYLSSIHALFDVANIKKYQVSLTLKGFRGRPDEYSVF